MNIGASWEEKESLQHELMQEVNLQQEKAGFGPARGAGSERRPAGSGEDAAGKGRRSVRKAPETAASGSAAFFAAFPGQSPGVPCSKFWCGPGLRLLNGSSLHAPPHLPLCPSLQSGHRGTPGHHGSLAHHTPCSVS